MTDGWESTTSRATAGAGIAPFRWTAGPTCRRTSDSGSGTREGDTLVVDTTNFTDQTNYMGSGEHLHLIERFTRVAPDLLQYKITVEDPTVWTRPWTMELAPTLQDSVQNLIFEAACHEGNYSLTAMLAGARMEEAVEAGAR